MKKIYANYLSKFTNPIRSATALIWTICLTSVVVSAQTVCPDPGGGSIIMGLDQSSPTTTNLYPQGVPAGQPSGYDRATIGRLTITDTVINVIPSNVAIIRPILTNGTTGSVALYFKDMNFGDAPNAELRIFQGTSTAGTPVITINAANSASFPGTSLSYVGPVTIEFRSPTAGTSGDFNIYVRYSTGDQVFDSSFGRKVAAWTDFVQPDSYTFVDDHRGTVPNPPQSDNWNPICIAHFDANRQFVSADRSYCVDSPRRNVGTGWGDYPGRTNFTSYVNFDIDRSGTIDGTDQLKMARLAWLMANTTVPVGNLRLVQEQVWTIVGSGYGGGSETAVPSLPTPVEPTFSISAGSSAVSGKPSTFTVNFTNTGSGANRLKLIAPAGVTISSVTGTGVSYSGNFINFSSTTGTATIQAISSTAQTAQLQVVYDESGYWNVSNLKVYQPCDNGQPVRQDFVGMSQGVTTHPHREASATWTAATALACTDGYYYVENINGTTSLYRYNLGGTTLRTLITSVTGDYNAMGYSVIDNFLWGYDRTTNQVFKLGSDGSELFTIPNMPTPATSTSRSVGTVDLNGYLYLYESNATEYITIDINPGRSTYLQIVDPTNSYIAKTGAPWGTTTTARNISDWAYNPTTGMIHAIINGAGSNALLLSQLNPVTGISTLSTTPISGTNFTTGTNTVFDSQFFDASGNLIVFSSFWFSINLASNTATQLWDKASPLTTNDGAACLSINSPTAFDCSDLYYQVEGDKLYSLDESGERTTIATLSGNLNAIGYSTVDNALWGFDNTTAQVFRLGANGVIQRFAISNMPAATQPDGFSLGTVGTNGYLFLYEKNGLNYITIDIDPARPETYLKIVDPTASFALKTAAPWGTTLGGGARGISDWAYNPVDNLIYALIDGSAANPYQILQVNPTTGATTLLASQVTGGGLQTSSQNFGSSFIDAEGNFMVFGNTTGHLYLVNITSKTAQQISTVATPSSSNDGAFCPLTVYTPLPVVLISFEAAIEKATVRLHWSTTLESNSSGFEIQRSADAKNWNKLDFVPSQTTDGTSKTQQNYNFDDVAPLNGQNYYRLKLMDIDGKYTYSRMRTATFGSKNSVTVYPNPVTDGQLTIDSGAEIITSLEVYNLTGMKVMEKSKVTSKVLNVGGLTPGLYLLKTVNSRGEASVKTFSVR